MPSVLRMRARPFAALIFMARILLFGLRLVEGDDQRLHVPDLDEIADFHALQVLGILDLDRLLTALRAFQRDPLRLAVDTDDLARDGDLAADRAGWIVARLGPGLGLGDGGARRRAAGGLELNRDGLDVGADDGIADLDGLELGRVLHVEGDRAAPRALERDRLVVLVDGGDGAAHAHDRAFGLAGHGRVRARGGRLAGRWRLGTDGSGDGHGQ